MEHPFGTIKCWMGATHFLTKRLPKVAAGPAGGLSSVKPRVCMSNSPQGAQWRVWGAWTIDFHETSVRLSDNWRRSRRLTNSRAFSHSLDPELKYVAGDWCSAKGSIARHSAFLGCGNRRIADRCPTQAGQDSGASRTAFR